MNVLAAKILIAGVIAVASVISSVFYMMNSADSVADAVGSYAIALGIIPALFGAFIGGLGALVFAVLSKTRIIKSIWIPVVGVAGALLPIAWTLWAMSQPGH